MLTILSFIIYLLIINSHHTLYYNKVFELVITFTLKKKKKKKKLVITLNTLTYIYIRYFLPNHYATFRYSLSPF